MSESNSSASDLSGLVDAALQQIDPGDPDAAIQLADLLIGAALGAHASDIHIHPVAEGALVRFRIDGRLHVAARVPPVLAEPLVIRLKVMARLVVFQRSTPQDGRIDWSPESEPLHRKEVSGAPVALRVAFLPTLHGEDVVVRLPETSRRPLTLDALGMSESTHRQVRRLLQLEQGTFLLTGPSSSGKTTTIYAILRALHRDRGEAAHILTLEDPIEQNLDFAGQVPIRPDQGLDWLTALRSVLRHDPNVILIGEIRDRETAEIAIQAGLTGHFVISTVHSGRAVGVLVRLVHMDVEPFLVASSVTATLAQRLVRRLCPECRVAVAPGPELQSQLGLNEGETLWTSRGCEACGSTGSQGRVGVFELLVVGPALREGVMNRRPEATLQSIGFPDGNALVADALEKARAGVIGMDELSRIAAATLLGTADKEGR